MFYLERVVQQVVAHHFVVGPIAGNAIYIRELFATFGDAAAILIPAVRLMRAIPEAPGLAGRRCLQKVGEVAGIVAVADTWNNFWKDGKADGIGSNLSRK